MTDCQLQQEQALLTALPPPQSAPPLKIATPRKLTCWPGESLEIGASTSASKAASLQEDRELLHLP